MSSFTTPLQYDATGKVTKGGNPIYRITEEFSYSFGSLASPLAIFTVPVGFETDLASIPFPFNKFFPPDGPWAKAAVLHDWLITKQQHISKLVQDAIFLEAMQVLQVNPIIAYVFFLSVRFYRSIIQINRVNQLDGSRW